MLAAVVAAHAEHESSERPSAPSCRGQTTTRLRDWMGRGGLGSGDEDLLVGDEAAQVGGIGRAGLAQCSAVSLQPRVALHMIANLPEARHRLIGEHEKVLTLRRRQPQRPRQRGQDVRGRIRRPAPFEPHDVAINETETEAGLSGGRCQWSRLISGHEHDR